ncbi:MAG: tetratricopeptide repeat protein [Cyanobacteria bacterium P01_D01_bin.156]
MNFFSRLNIFLALSSVLVTVNTVTATYAQTSELQIAQTEATDQTLKQEADDLYNQGNRQANSQQFLQAEESLEKALTLYQSLGDRNAQGNVYFSLGNLYFKLEDYAKSLNYQQQALEIAQEIQDQNLEASISNNVGNIYFEQDELALALQYYEATLAILAESPNPQLEIITLGNLGRRYYEQDRFEEFIPLFERRLELVRAANNPDLEAQIIDQLLEVYEILEQPETENTLKLQADQLFLQGTQQLNLEQVLEAQQSLELALNRYQELGDQSAVGQTYKQLGNVYFFQENYEASLNYQQQALDVAKMLQDKDLEARALNNIGNVYNATDDQTLAIDFYQKALEVAKNDSNGQIVIVALKNLRKVYFEQDALEDYIQVSEQLLGIALNTTDAKASFNLSLGIVGAQNRLGNVDKAVNFAALATELLSKVEDDQFILNSYEPLFDFYDTRRDYRELVTLSESLLDASRRLSDLPNEVGFLSVLSLFHRTLSNYDASIEAANALLAIALENQNEDLEALANFFLAQTYSEQGELQKAIEFSERSAALARQAKDLEAEISANLLTAEVYLNQGEFQKAIEFSEKSAALAQQADDLEAEANSLRILANSLRKQNRYREAIEAAEESIQVAQKSDSLGSIVTVFQARLSLTFIYFDLGDYQRASETSQEMIAGLESFVEVNLSEAGVNGELIEYLAEFSNLFNSLMSAMYLFTQNDYQQMVALLSMTDLAFLEKSSEGNSIFNADLQTLDILIKLLLALGYNSLGDYDAGLRVTKAAIDLSQSISSQTSVGQFSIIDPQTAEGVSLFLIGDMERRRGNFNTALKYYQEANAIVASSTIKVGLARTYSELGLTNTAISHYKNAVKSTEVRRENITSELDSGFQSFFLQKVDADGTRVSDVYRELADLLLSQGRIPEAQQVLDLLKVEELNEFVGNTRATWTTDGLQYTDLEKPIVETYDSLIALGREIYECLQTNCAQRNELFDQQDKLNKQYNTQIEGLEKIVRENRRDDEIFQDPDNLSSKSQAILEANPDSILIYPLVTEDRLWLLWATVGSVVGGVEVDASQGELASTVQAFGEQLNSRGDLDTLNTQSQKLYNWLVAPLEEELQKNNIKSLIFVNDRVTRYIPMASLYDGERYLLERYTISTVLAPGLTDTTDRLDSPEQSQILGLGLTQPVSGFNPLPAVEQELDAIIRSDAADQRGIYPGKIYLDDAFTLQQLKEDVYDHRVLHIATHAAFVPGQPDDSYIVLGNGERLQIPDIKAMGSRLSNLHLVVLSACQTALGGATGDGSEIAGISSYFLQQDRAESVIASLWAVNDGSTSVLMQRFYEFLATGELSKAEALRQAQLSLLESNQSGDGDTRIIGQRQTDIQGDALLSHPYFWAPFILIGNSL